MIVSIRKALELNGLVTADLDYVELYSCFPCVPKMARRVIGWPVERAASVFGGLTFGGGPVGNYMSHAVVSMVLALRQTGRHGLLFANGGLATHNHSIVLSRAPPAANIFPQSFDFQAEADSLRGPAPPVQEDYLGPATVETYTVLYDREGSGAAGRHHRARAERCALHCQSSRRRCGHDSLADLGRARTGRHAGHRGAGRGWRYLCG